MSLIMDVLYLSNDAMQAARVEAVMVPGGKRV